MIKYTSNNCIKINSIEYVSRYIIENNDFKLYSILEYNKNINDYKLIKSTFNVYAFIEYIKNNNYKKYFSLNENELIKE